MLLLLFLNFLLFVPFFALFDVVECNVRDAEQSLHTYLIFFLLVRVTLRLLGAL